MSALKPRSEACTPFWCACLRASSLVTFYLIPQSKVSCCILNSWVWLDLLAGLFRGSHPTLHPEITSRLPSPLDFMWILWGTNSGPCVCEANTVIGWTISQTHTPYFWAVFSIKDWWPLSLRDPPASASLALELVCYCFWILLSGCWGCQFRSSGLHGKHFTTEPSPQPPVNLYAFVSACLKFETESLSMWG